MSTESEPKVLNFYRGSTILIVGGTGFLGKVLLEKILRCLQVQKVYLMIRQKGGINTKERLEQLLKDRLFDGVRQHVHKIEPIDADYDECANFGLDEQLCDRLRKEVQVVFYCLATIKFNETLKQAVTVNVCITENMMTWFKGFPCLKSFVYTSTFYSNCNQFFVEERVTRELPFGNYELCMNLLETLSEDDCEKIKATLVGDFPNTYTFSKKLSEIMIEQEFTNEMPIGIYRPPVVSPTDRAPLPGWTDNFFGPSAFIRGNLDGVKTVVLGDMNSVVNFAPVDYCANAMLICGYDVALRNDGTSDPSITVYNHHSDGNRCSFGKTLRYMADARKTVWERFLGKLYISTSNKKLFYVLLYINILLAMLRDLLVSWMGGAGRNRNYYRRSAQFFGIYNDIIYFAMTRSWKSDSTNLKHLKNHLSEKEAEMFYFEVEEIDWPAYWKKCVNGVSQLLEERARKSSLKIKPS